MRKQPRQNRAAQENMGRDAEFFAKEGLGSRHGIPPPGYHMRDWIDVSCTTKHRESWDTWLRWNWHRQMRNEAEVTTAVAPSTLTAEDRCDRCGAQAYLRVELQTGGELLFCAHHAREHGEALKEIAVNLQDETHKLQDTPASTPDNES